jgi:hypothetical protein
MNNPSRRETPVLERYQQLAGLVKDGQMVNADKESRARAWVVEQEKIKILNKKDWHGTVLGKIVIGLFVTIVGGLILAWIL